MKMVAAAKFRRAQESIVSARPYARKIGTLLRYLLSTVDSARNPFLKEREIKAVALVVVTADRGLCGGFNSNIIRTAVQQIKSQYSDHLKSERLKIITIGKKAFDYFNKHGYPVYAKHVGIFQSLDFNHARTIVEEIAGAYLQGTVDQVVVIYNEFKTVVQQRIVVEQFLPVPPPDVQSEDESASELVDYIFEPSSTKIIEAMVPRHLNFQMWRVLLESNAAEQGARMTAMENATENAKEMIRDLTLVYNNARQAAITKELLEITGGAEALKKAG